MFITAQFDSGNIEVIEANEPSAIQLAIRKDNQSDFYQWFHFKLYAKPGVEHVMTITNAGQSAYPEVGKITQRWPHTIAKLGSVCQPSTTAKNLLFVTVQIKKASIMLTLRHTRTNATWILSNGLSSQLNASMSC